MIHLYEAREGVSARPDRTSPNPRLTTHHDAFILNSNQPRVMCGPNTPGPLICYDRNLCKLYLYCKQILTRLSPKRIIDYEL